MTAAQNLVQSLNAGDAAVNQVREQADQHMASSVSTINTLLGQFQTANDAVVSGLASGANVSSGQDTRDFVLTQLAQQIGGVTTSTNKNGSMLIYTDSGVLLFQDTARTVSFTPTQSYADGVSGSAVTVDTYSSSGAKIESIPITGPTSPSPIQSGALAGYADLRDTVAPQYQAQLDQIAGGLISAFEETDQANPTPPNPLPGLFTYVVGANGQQAASLPSDTTGLAGAIAVNQSVDPSQGGNATLLRDGGIAGPDYVYNSDPNATSYTTRLQALIGEIGSKQVFDTTATGLGGSSTTPPTTMTETLTDFANASVSWLQGQNQQASDASAYQNALATQATSALSNATGVNLDAEMTNMLSLENTYEIDGEASDHDQRHVLRSAAGRMTMSPTYVSTQYLANSLVLPVQQAQGQLTTAITEESTGQYADLGLQLGDQSGYELSLKEQVQQMQTLTSGNSVVATNLSTAQNALTSMATAAETALKNLATWTAGASSGAQLQAIGQTALEGLTSSANASSSNGGYIFGGINSAAAPLNDYFSAGSAASVAVDAAFKAAFNCLPTDPAAASITASQMQTFLSGTTFTSLFSGSQWTADWSPSSSTTNTQAQIAPGRDPVTTSTNVNTPTFQNLAEAYTMVAAFGGSSLSAAAQQAVASAATTLVSQGQNALTVTQATLGATQSQVTDANSAMSSQLTLIQTQIGNLDNVDQTATASKIMALTNQIQMAYELTSRLQNLTLAQYLPA